MLGVDNADLAAQLEAAHLGLEKANQGVEEGKVSVQSMTIWIVALTLMMTVMGGIGFGVWRWYYCKFQKGQKEMKSNISYLEEALSEARSMTSDSLSMIFSASPSISDIIDPEGVRFHTDLASINESECPRDEKCVETESHSTNAIIHEQPESSANVETVNQEDLNSSTVPTGQESTMTSTESTNCGQSNQNHQTNQVSVGKETVREVSEITVM